MRFKLSLTQFRYMYIQEGFLHVPTEFLSRIVTIS